MIQYAEHAARCGIPMQGRVALGTRAALRRWCAVDVLHPETLDPIIPAGWWIGQRDIELALAAGVDYIVCDA